MLTGDPPYYSDDIENIYSGIKGGMLRFPKGISETSKSFIRVFNCFFLFF